MTLHLKTWKSRAQEIITELRGKNAIDVRYQIQRDELYVFIPITEAGKELETDSTVLVDIGPLDSKAKSFPKTAGGAFDLIGNIAITKIRNRERALKLAEDLLKTHTVIRSVYLDKGITGKFRLRDLELLSGDESYLAKYRENGIYFELDVSKVYFSPRLATERMFVAKDVMEGEYIIDMFAGIGAFSLNIAKLHSAMITAIDSNPDAIDFMRKCISLNTLKGTITPVCGDAADVLSGLPEADRIIMNLPHEAQKFLELAIEKLKAGGTMHYYEILDVNGLEARMEQFRSLGLEILKKREVHGYSSTLSMYSLTATRSWE